MLGWVTATGSGTTISKLYLMGVGQGTATESGPIVSKLHLMRAGTVLGQVTPWRVAQLYHVWDSAGSSYSQREWPSSLKIIFNVCGTRMEQVTPMESGSIVSK